MQKNVFNNEQLLLQCGLIPVSKIKARSAKDISSNKWDISCTALDRNYTVYENYKSYVGPLGAKSARLQSGWAKTERSKGVYDFKWIECVVDDLLEQGINAWFGLNYGNPVYKGGGGHELGAGLPSSAEGLAAWDSYVQAAVKHFYRRIFHWEVWNEPNGIGIMNDPEGKAAHIQNAAEYGELFIRTAEIIKSLQPEARIAGLSTAGIPLDYITVFLDHLKLKDKLHLIDEVSFHDKPVIPDKKYPAVDQLRSLVAGYSGRIVVVQGENGCPSVPRGQDCMALSQYDWSERSQAKWYLRDMLGDYARNIPHSIFALIDIHYPGFVLHKGLLESTSDMRVKKPKESYYAVQNTISIFDDRFKRIKNPDYHFDIPAKSPDSIKTAADNNGIILYAFQEENSTLPLFTVWIGDQRPAHDFPVVPVQITFKNIQFHDPVCVDLLSGLVFDIPKEFWFADNTICTFKRLPIYDSPVLVAERRLIVMKDSNESL